jgi:hypothetical protein
MVDAITARGMTVFARVNHAAGARDVHPENRFMVAFQP